MEEGSPRLDSNDLEQPVEDKPVWLHEGLPKHLATVLMSLHTEVFGLNARLAQVRAPRINPHCVCRWHEQTIKYVFFGCPRFNASSVVQVARMDNLTRILSNAASARAAARCFVQAGLLKEFQLAEEIDREDLDEYRPLPEPERW